MKKPSLLYSITTTVILITLLSFVSWFQVQHDRLSPPFSTRLKLAKRNLLPDQILPYISFGFSNIIADFYWIRAIQDFVAWNGKEGFFIGYFKNIATLDPRFEYPYLFSILTIPQKPKEGESIERLDTIANISQKGIDAIKDGWQIPFYLGTQYYLFTKKYDPAEKYLAIAAEKKDAPDGVYLIYSTFVGRNSPKPIRGDEDARISRSLLKVIYNSTTNETTKKLIERGLQEEAIYQMLEKGIIAFKEKYKKYPRTIEEVIAVNFIKLPDAFLDYFDIIINQKNGSFKVEERK